MIILPDPPTQMPPGFINLELALKRDQTMWFIAANPSQMILTPVRRDRTAGGGFTEVNLTPRPIQTLRVISMSAAQKPTLTENGIEREIDLTLLGPHDAEIEIGDWWLDSENLRYEVIEMVPPNGYEVRALVVKKGHG